MDRSDGKTAVLSWTPSAGAEYYNIYKNGKLIAISDTSAYTDENSEDGAVYSVTGYDVKNGESLLSSN